MDLLMVEMNADMAREISTWKYDPPYQLYNLDGTAETVREFLDGSYTAVVDADEGTTGYFCVGIAAQVPLGSHHGAYMDDSLVDVGFGMRPDLTGQGRGFEFVSAILAFVASNVQHNRLRLTVATFNRRAIRLYENLGFTPVMEFPVDDVRFMTMVKAPPW